MSQDPKVIQVAVPRPLHAVYDYALPKDMPLPSLGARVKVPFGRSQTIGICTNLEVENPHPKPKAISDLIDTERLIPSDLMDLASWMQTYYHHPLGEVLATIIPAAARRGEKAELEEPDHWRLVQTDYENKRAKAQMALVDALRLGSVDGSELLALGHKRATLRKLAELGIVEKCNPEPNDDLELGPEPNSEQRTAIDAILASRDQFQAFLLDGITGSGKTEVYLRVIDACLAQGRQALVLVPEIALTPQTVGRFQRRFARVAALHSAMTDRERLQTWLKCRDGDVDVLIGTRSSVFTPFKALGVIIVDEEHDSSYKQQDGLRYSARDIAAKRGFDLNLPVVFGSATPSLESLHNVARDRYQNLVLTERAGGARLPTYHLIDLRGQSHTDGISVPLQHVIRRHLEAQNQVLVFLNRRGYSPTLLCASCGWQAMCPNCDARLTLHQSPSQLVCHHCSTVLETPKKCEGCGAPALMPVGLGTQRTEQGLKKLFKDVPIYRIDRDTTRSAKALEAQFARINSGGSCIMVGTQMLAKGHHFPDVTLVVILNADSGFLSPDFRAPERTAQLIVQVAGRSGRAQKPGEVWIQSYQPDNPTLQSLIKDGYGGFAQHELAIRKKVGMPPHHAMAMIRADAFQPNEANQFLTALKSTLRGIEVLGPVAAPLARIANRSRMQMMLLAPTRQVLHAALNQAQIPKPTKALRWSIDIDPYDSL